MSLDHLVGGAVYGASLAFVAIAIPRATRYVLAAVLTVAALACVPFAIAADAGAVRVAVELASAGVFGYAAKRGIRGSAWWLVAGFALHPIWDAALHLAGAGPSVAPEWYATSSLSYDLAVAAVGAIAILVGTHLSEAPAGTPVQPLVSPRRAPVCTCTTCCTMRACAA